MRFEQVILNKRVVLWLLIVQTFTVYGQSDKELHNFIRGDWYTIVQPELDYSPDSIYREFAFLDSYMEYYDLNLPLSPYIPYYEIKNEEWVGYRDKEKTEIQFKAVIKIIDSTTFELISDAVTHRFYRLDTDEYKLSDLLLDNQKIPDDLSIPNDIERDLTSVIETYYHNCYLRRYFSLQLTKGWSDKSEVETWIRENKLNDRSIYEVRRFEDFIRMINDIY